MKIVAMLPVKNEAWVLRQCLRSLRFCDEILAIDDDSTDETRLILQEYDCTIVQLDTATKIGWKEYEIRSLLLHEARQHGATHLVAIDGDEMFSDAFVGEARNKIKELATGEALSLPWVNIVDSEHIYEPILTKPFIIHDDGSSQFHKTFMHVPRVPTYVPGKIVDLPYAVLHFQHMHAVRNRYKNIWYMMSELRKGERSAMRINATYRPQRFTRRPYDVATLTTDALPDPATDTKIWQQEQVLQLLIEQGPAYFESLDIWQEPALRERFIAEVGREPKPTIAPSWLLQLNDAKNKLKNWYHAHAN